ncbi:hemolysin III family protein [Phenylobacterium sp.]|uniref:PAQR family membrane homeostasis protein TrhA n=1 Tax=Phenylobacterium sp. TaxID=1871053 RepID=UPI00286BC1C9|nr:hemolysin III family protein [Phenylobacterium sp.]
MVEPHSDVPPRHYPTAAAKCADLVVHVMGLTLALVGGIVLLVLAVSNGVITQVVGVSIYAAGVVAMLAFSTAYNFAKPRYRPVLRRLDHAGIFLMIAGSYTPFTLHLPGAWGPGMTIAVWSVAGLGGLCKLMFVGVDRRLWVAVYLMLGWLVVVALKPMIDTIAWYALALLVTGGVLYSTGVIFYLNKKLKYARAIWHGHVIAGAAAHWCAVLFGVVLASNG